MDPKMCLLDLIAKIYEDDPDKDRIEELVEAYEGWRKGQGFEPKFDTIDFAANEAFKFYNVGKQGIDGDALFGMAKLHIAMRFDGCPFCGKTQIDNVLGDVWVEDGFAFETRQCHSCQGVFENKYEICGMLIRGSDMLWKEISYKPRKLVKVHVEGGVVNDVEIPSDDIVVEVHDRDDDSEEQVSVSEWTKEE